jgi:antitoxin component YwqK of YwqJK toxin-antitoxin module
MRTFILLCLAAMISACQDNAPKKDTPNQSLPSIEETTAEVTESFPSGAPKKATYKQKTTGAKVADLELYESGQTYLDRRYTNDTLNGTSYSYYGDGKTWSMNNYKMGAYHGPYQLWWPNGQVRLTGHYTDGLEDGEWINFYDNGRIDTRGFYKNGQKAGTWTTYNKEGKLLKETNFDAK